MCEISKKTENSVIRNLCSEVKDCVRHEQYEKGESLIYEAMREYPHAAEPHNLIGIVLEKEGDHAAAMKHFRAAWALDPTYLPARYNLELFGTFWNGGDCAFDTADCR